MKKKDTALNRLPRCKEDDLLQLACLLGSMGRGNGRGQPT